MIHDEANDSSMRLRGNVLSDYKLILCSFGKVQDLFVKVQGSWILFEESFDSANTAVSCLQVFCG